MRIYDLINIYENLYNNCVLLTLLVKCKKRLYFGTTSPPNYRLEQIKSYLLAAVTIVVTKLITEKICIMNFVYYDYFAFRLE